MSRAQTQQPSTVHTLLYNSSNITNIYMYMGTN